MKIIFICSSLEPGCDGVGDYTRRLATELIRQGHLSVAISINDKHIDKEYAGNQISGAINLPVLRLPSSMTLKNRLTCAKRFIDEFNPDWISLQFVIFGYHAKGLPLWLNKLAILSKGWHTQIMFHELWLGMEVQAIVKHMLWGKIQKVLIKSLIKAIKPQIIHTHTRLYQQKLSELGLNVQHLPLFGNIPVSNYVGNDLCETDFIKFVIFGHLHPNVPIADFVKELIEYVNSNNLKTSLTLIGICGPKQEDWIHEWESVGISVTILGIQPVAFISQILSASTIGISTTPSVLIEKSGSVAAMREHGLPVVCIPAIWDIKLNENLNLPPGIAVYKKGNLKSILTKKVVNLQVNDVFRISTQFMNSLK